MKIVLTDSYAADRGTEEWPGLSDLGAVLRYPRCTSAEVLDRAHDATALVINKTVISADVLAALPNLRYVGVSATGTNVVDLDAARTAGIAVTNVPGYSTASVAQLVFALLLELTLDVAGHSEDVKRGGWAASPDFSYTRRPLPELAGKTLAIVGSGAIGSAVARIAEAFGLRTLKAAVPGSPSRDRVPLDEALAAADFVTLHAPLTPTTQRLVDAAFCARLRPGAILINTSRGGLLDEQAVVAALDSGRLGGLAVDVLTTEPPAVDHPFTRTDAPWSSRVLVTPHIGWATVEARDRLRREVTENLRAFVAGTRRNRVD